MTTIIIGSDFSEGYMDEDKKYIKLEEEYIVITIPSHTVAAEINCTVYENGKLQDVSKKMDMDEIKEAVEIFETIAEYYIPSDATFSLTDKGIELLESSEECEE